jgi:uncharacterized protein YjiS (DUF1127 family)
MALALDHHLKGDRRGKGATAGHGEQKATLGWLRHAFRRIVLWNQKHRQRRALLELDDHQLSDIGISREAARREAAKYFWE